MRFGGLVGCSDSFTQMIQQAKKLAVLDAPLLIQGETGTGKELLARACHQLSPRSEQPFLVLNCVSMPDEAVENEIFGCIRGDEVQKGIFEQADGGTLFLDEIGEMSPLLQIKLLRFLEDGTFRRVGEDQEIHVNVRVICATKFQLSSLVSDTTFREDLYFRLNVLKLNIEPLRKRSADIDELIQYFVQEISQELVISEPEIDADLYPFLAHYTWPGNERQLRNTLYRSLTLISDNRLSAADISLPQVENQMDISDNLEGTLDEIMKRYESSVLSHLYQDFPSTRKLAKRLGVSHTAIANKLREYKIGKEG